MGQRARSIKLFKREAERYDRLLNALGESKEPFKVILAVLNAKFSGDYVMVPSSARTHFYRVHLETNHCSCPAFGHRCHHLKAARLATQLRDRYCPEIAQQRIA